MTYVIQREELGELERQSVLTVHMPRARYLEILDATIESLDVGTTDYRDDVRDEVWPVAETMTRFPFDTWLHDRRGCGCLIGEYLIARREIDEHNAQLNAVQRLVEQRIATIRAYTEVSTIEDLMGGNPLREELHTLGGRIDSRLRNELYINEPADPDELTGYPDDDDDRPNRAYSVEVIVFDD